MIDINSIVDNQKEYFFKGNTLSVSYRIDCLNKLYTAIESNSSLIYDALKNDLGKNRDEAYISEIGLLLNEISYIKKKLKRWVKPHKVKSILSSMPSSGYTLYSPYGVVLIIAPWNYPFLLTFQPLIGAIAAGNCAVVKPSEIALHSADVITKIISETFSQECVSVVNGDKYVVEELLKCKFDYLFYTGNFEVGKSIMQKISQFLIPATFELGGKSPCIIDSSANLKIAARRIVFGKLFNAGQTCVAPDYIIVTKDIRDRLIDNIILEIRRQYGDNILDNDSFGKIINRRHFERILSLIDPDRVVYGGKSSEQLLKIEPTILVDISMDDKIMKEEIFGPIIPIITIDNILEAKFIIEHNPTPLAIYIFSESKHIIDYFLNEISFGGACVNDTIMHLASPYLPFGGVGSSGFGNYHGKYSFITFSHEKSISKGKTYVDIPIRYQPYSTLKRKIINIMLK